jgi:hypothetical protein
MKTKSNKGNWPEYSITLDYIDKDGNRKRIVRKWWSTVADFAEIARTAVILEKTTNKDATKFLGVSVKLKGE